MAWDHVLFHVMHRRGLIAEQTNKYKKKAAEAKAEDEEKK